MVLYAIDGTKKCYAIKIFPTPFDAIEDTFDDYLSKSMDDAGLLCDQIARGSLCDIARHPQISECHDVSPSMLEYIIKRCQFGKCDFQFTLGSIEFNRFHWIIYGFFAFQN